MKTQVIILAMASALFLVGCRHADKKENKKEVTVTANEVKASESDSNLIVIAKDIISEVVVRPDTLGDPWEVEKVKNYSGKRMFDDLFDNIYRKKLIVYDITTGKPLDPETVRNTAKEFGNDYSKIGKIQFTEDWYYNTSTNKINKKIKSVLFAYEVKRQKGLPAGYKALFKLNVDQ